MKIALTALLVAAVSANPLFAPKQSENSAKAEYISNLVRGAKPLRKLENNNNYATAVDLSSYSVKFEKCQFVKAYADDLAATEEKEADSSTAAATATAELAPTTAQHHFAIFRLCPNNDCSSCDSNYGEYLMDLDAYLETTVRHFQNWQEQMCSSCHSECEHRGEANSNNTNNNASRNNRKLELVYSTDCDTCFDECEKVENMEDYGYYDATDLLECQLIYDPEDDSMSSLYAAPICAAGGSKIKIGVFTDENCQDYDSLKDVDDYMISAEGSQMKLSHAMLKKTYMDTCISCMEPPQNNQEGYDNNNQDADNVNELCENLYNHAAKCERANGFFDNSNYVEENHDYGYYENELFDQEEELVCEFLESLKQSGRNHGNEG